MAYTHAFVRGSAGAVPIVPSLLEATVAQVTASLVGGDAMICTDKMQNSLDFTAEGCTPDELRRFLQEALALGRSSEPICETGNKVGAKPLCLSPPPLV
jgi:hypothetical protein